VGGAVGRSDFAVKTAPLILVGLNGEPHVSAWPGLAGASEAPSTSTAFTGYWHL